LNADLFFDLNKLVSLVFAPARLLLWLTLATGIALLLGRVRTGRALALATAVIFIAFGVLPLGDWLARPLENQYPRPAPPPARVDGILTLGGGLGTGILTARGAPADAESETRLVSTFELARRYLKARVVFSGGWGADPDSTAAAYIFAQMGLDPARLTLEDRSRDTYENLLFSQRLVRPKPGEVWVLATSALQTPRAMAVARRLGWTLIPWPTDYKTSPSSSRRPLADYLNVTSNLTRVDQALHEWVGLLSYQLGGFARRVPAASTNAARPAP
jgi:uncharacterized SAM-binding protein YcdF (DUF218 family)